MNAHHVADHDPKYNQGLRNGRRILQKATTEVSQKQRPVLARHCVPKSRLSFELGFRKIFKVYELTI